MPLTEVFADFLYGGCAASALFDDGAHAEQWVAVHQTVIGAARNNYGYLAALAALLVGLCTLFRPETPYAVGRAWIVLADRACVGSMKRSDGL